MRIRPLIPVLGCALCVVALVTSVTASALARTRHGLRIVIHRGWGHGNPLPPVPDPPRNFTAPSPGAECAHSFSARCEDDYVYYLDKARNRMGLVSYRLPNDFTELAPTEQLFVLMNLDRIAYGVAPVTGMVGALDASSQKFMYRDQDPRPPAAYLAHGAAEVWAGNYPNPLAAYFAWMYDDGPGSSNVDCAQATPSGCWAHRRAIFFQPRHSGAGISVGRDEAGAHSYAMDVVGLQRRERSYVYTWAEARRAGAGTHRYRVPKP